MNRNWIRALMVPGLLLASTATTQANDLVKFFNAISGGSRQGYASPAVQPVGHHDHGGPGIAGQGFSGPGPGDGYGGRELTSRDVYKLQTANRAAGYGGYGAPQFGGSSYAPNNRVNLREHNFGQSGYGRPADNGPSGSQLRFRVSANTGFAQGYRDPLYVPNLPPAQPLPPVQSYPPVDNYPPVQGNSQFHALPHQIGEIVDCPVPLATCVRVERTCNISPNAVPVVVAVRDPNQCARECPERVVYVQVFVPPCPPHSITVSPCHTRVTMCFGKYSVTIRSNNGSIVVTYRD